MAAERQRWRDVREFLDDLPVLHCQVKPPHEFCTICMRINYGVAYDCPLYGRPYIAPAKKPAAGGAARAHEEPVRASVTPDVARDALRGEEFPVIEFAGPRRAKQAAAPKAREGDEAPLDVEALEVVAMEEAPTPRAGPPAPAAHPPAAPEAPPAASAPPAAAPPAEAAESASPAKPPAAAPKVDPEELMHRIMEELEIPEEEEAPEDEVRPDVDGGADGEAKPSPAAQKAPQPGGPGEPEAPASGPRVSEKRIVLRRKKKGG